MSKMLNIIFTLCVLSVFRAFAAENVTTAVKGASQNVTVAPKVAAQTPSVAAHIPQTPSMIVPATKSPSLEAEAPHLHVVLTTAAKVPEDVSEEISKPLFVAEANSSIILWCPVEGKDIYWSKNGENITEGKLYKLHPTNGTLEVIKVGPDCFGDFECSNGSHKENVTVWVKPYVHEPEKKSKNVIEGDPFVLECKVWGYPAVSVTWMHKEKPIVIDERITFKKDTSNLTLRITHSEYEDAGKFECIAENKFGNASMYMEMNVKDKLAALWPFLGICAEVAILCIIIVIFEKRRSKRLEAEERREETDRLNSGNDAKLSEELRHRKQ